MNPDVKELWVSALRSGDFSQGKNLLHTKGKGDEPDKYCCLGVLCAIAVENGVIREGKLLGEPDDHQYYSYGDSLIDRSTAFLPLEVRQWAQISSDNGAFLSDGVSKSDTLIRLNDDGISFNDIAGVIEEKF